MDSEDEHDHHHHDQDNDHDENPADTVLTGFLFGNIDKKGELEDDVLDQVMSQISTIMQSLRTFCLLNKKNVLCPALLHMNIAYNVH